jgi:hypothetical protein
MSASYLLLVEFFHLSDAFECHDGLTPANDIGARMEIEMRVAHQQDLIRLALHLQGDNLTMFTNSQLIAANCSFLSRATSMCLVHRTPRIDSDENDNENKSSALLAVRCCVSIRCRTLRTPMRIAVEDDRDVRNRSDILSM